MRTGGFAGTDEPLDPGGRRAATSVEITSPSPRDIATSPALAALQTADAIGVASQVDRALRDIDHGDWAVWDAPMLTLLAG